MPDCKRPLFKDVIGKVQFAPTKKGEKFGPSWYTYWFKIDIKVPSEWTSQRVVFHWDCENEGMVFTDDGKVQVGLSGEERQEWVLPKSMKDGKWHTFYIESACNGMFGNADPNNNIQPPIPDRYFTLQKADLLVPNDDARALKADFEVIAEAASELPEQSWQRHRALEVGNEMINAFDNTDPESIARCRQIATKFLGSKVDSEKVYSAGDENASVFAVGHCHIDTAWLWPYAETRRKIARSWASQLDLIERYPEYNFACSQAIQYQWLKEDYPELFERLKAQVKKGRFLPVGGSWVESDTNLPTGESIARQFLYGQRWFMSNFGIRSETYWLPDTFGYSAQIPQLCRLAGMKRFLTQKLSWNNINRFPHTTFNWVALDGSQVLCHMPPADTYNSSGSLAEVKKTVENNRNRGVNKDGLLLFGTGDGGGGPTVEMLERLRRARGLADTAGYVPQVHLGGTVDKYFDKVEKDTENGKALSTWMGELYFEFHRGTYTTEANTKQGNRWCEVLLHDIELVATYASLSNKDYQYPKKDLDYLWERILLNQFHDVLPGSSIEMVYDDAEAIYAEVEDKGKKLFEQAVSALAGNGEHAINTLSWPRDEVVDIPGKGATRIVSDGAGVARTAASSQGAAATAKEVESGVFVLDNGKLRVTIKGGALTSVIDLDEDREFILDGQKGNQLVIFEDQPLFWQGWDTEVYSHEKAKPVEQGKVSIAYEGPVRAAVQVEQQISAKSWIKTTISLDALAADGAPKSSYVEFNTEIEWREDTKFLKVQFPVDIHSDSATYDTMFGCVKRPTHYNTSWDVAKFEVNCHKYADLSEETYGVSVLNDSKYGFSIHGKVMQLSLLRSSKAPDGYADMGRHKIRYALLPHAGRLDGKVVRTAHNFNQPLRLVNAGDVSLGAIRYEGPEQVILSTIKRAEDDSDTSNGLLPNKNKGKNVIVRVYDSLGGKTKGKLVVDLPVAKVTKVNLLEQPLEEVQFSKGDQGTSIPITLRAFEIASFMVQIE